MFNDRFGLTQAVLDGRKTQTRRIITPQPTFKDNCGICWKGFAYGLSLSWDKLEGCYRNFISGTEYDKSCKRYRKGEVVAVAQSYGDCGGLNGGVRLWETIIEAVGADSKGWDNKMFVRADLMPHHIRITDVRVERLQDISDEDCLKEGLEWDGVAKQYYVDYQKETGRKTILGKTPREAFANLIKKVSKKDVWSENPYVFVYDFERMD